MQIQIYHITRSCSICSNTDFSVNNMNVMWWWKTPHGISLKYYPWLFHKNICENGLKQLSCCLKCYIVVIISHYIPAGSDLSNLQFKWQQQHKGTLNSLSLHFFGFYIRAFRQYMHIRATSWTQITCASVFAFLFPPDAQVHPIVQQPGLKYSSQGLCMFHEQECVSFKQNRGEQVL